MNIETRKLRLIKAFTSLKDVDKIEKIESILLPQTAIEARKSMLMDLSGVWSDEEASEIKKTIEEGCEKIDESEW